MKISYINEIANLCEAVGANVKQVAKAMGKDGRISPKFLHAGPGFGGSCFPKDTRALARIGRDHGENLLLTEACILVNELQKKRMAEKIITARGGDLSGKTIAALGLTFKPNTDDMREAPALEILPDLARAGAKIRAFDPEGEREGAWRLADLKDSLVFCDSEYEAVAGADAIVLLTEWNQFRSLDFERVKELAGGRFLFDLRNIYDRTQMEELGFAYYGVGC
jgi:UDPglucose 6-dehydrogenase